MHRNFIVYTRLNQFKSLSQSTRIFLLLLAKPLQQAFFKLTFSMYVSAQIILSSSFCVRLSPIEISVNQPSCPLLRSAPRMHGSKSLASFSFAELLGRLATLKTSFSLIIIRPKHELAAAASYSVAALASCSNYRGG